MINTSDLTAEFAAKLAKTGSMDEALIKVLWLAYKAGVHDERQLNNSKEFGYYPPVKNDEQEFHMALKTEIDAFNAMQPHEKINAFEEVSKKCKELHNKYIESEVPDIIEIINSKPLFSYVTANPHLDGMRILSNGTAQEIINFIKTYKSQLSL